MRGFDTVVGVILSTIRILYINETFLLFTIYIKLCKLAITVPTSVTSTNCCNIVIRRVFGYKENRSGQKSMSNSPLSADQNMVIPYYLH